MNDFDTKIIKSLIKLTISLDKLYKRNEELELQGKKNSQEYKKNLEYINDILEVEHNEYFKLAGNLPKLNQYYNYIYKISNADFFENYTPILKVNNVSRVYYRILYKLRDMIKPLSFDDNKLGINLSNYNADFVYNESNENTVLYDCMILNKAILDDILYLYLYNLNYCESDDQEKNKYKIPEKYNIAFINNSIENYMMENNYEVNYTPEFISDYVASTLNINYQDYLEFTNEIIREDAIYIMEKLKKIDLNQEFTFVDRHNILMNLSLLITLLGKLDAYNYQAFINYYNEILNKFNLKDSPFNKIIDLSILKSKVNKRKYIKVLKPIK